MSNAEEQQYLDLVRQIIETGGKRPDRTGTGTLSLFAPPQLRFSLSKPSTTSGSDPTLVLPLLTTKKVFTRGIIEELLWFVHGSTDSKLLSDKNVKIWDGNGSREFLDKVGLGHRAEGDLGPVYGFQWRHFGAEYHTARDNYDGQGVDQLAEVVRKIKENPMDRRIILSAWNPADIPKMALPPCHMFCQFYVTLPPADAPVGTKNRLSCIMYQRSADLGLGVPFNIASYALLTHMIAFVTDTIPHEFVLQIGDAHVYLDHVDALGTQLDRTPYEFPEFQWTRRKDDVGSIDGFKLEDFKVVGYKSHDSIPMKMSV
ncbi:thymidylate synthase [Sporobolomyces koalae]|uniref:thymidylate synthase n=1 Tax=Sporobolomyces koalae TaxID=500713 RepID=UPI0031771662